MAKTETADRSLAWPQWSLLKTLRRHSLAFGISALLLWVVAAPIVMLVLSSLREGNFITPGAFTFGNYKTVYLTSLTYPALLNTLIYAVAVSASA
jgi:ABC-type spermidine/putrescine transport system permease subunit II